MTGYRSGGSTVTETFDLNMLSDGVGGAPDFTTYVLTGFDGLTSLRIAPIASPSSYNGSSAFMMVDNLVVAESAVPEPSTGFLLASAAAGLAALRFAARKEVRS